VQRPSEILRWLSRHKDGCVLSTNSMSIDLCCCSDVYAIYRALGHVTKNLRQAAMLNDYAHSVWSESSAARPRPRTGEKVGAWALPRSKGEAGRTKSKFWVGFLGAERQCCRAEQNARARTEGPSLNLVPMTTKIADLSKTGSRNMAETCAIDFLYLTSYSTSIVLGGLRRLLPVVSQPANGSFSQV